MDEKRYTIILSDGTIIDKLKMNGNNFISNTPIDPKMFEGGLSPVIINNGEIEETHENMALVQVTKMGEDYWFVLRDMLDFEIENAKLRSDLDYVMMMTNIDI